MVSIFKGNMSFLAFLLLKKAPSRLIFVVLLKVLFIAFQVFSLWVIVPWITGHVRPAVKDLVGVNAGSYIYPFLSALSLLLAGATTVLSRKITLDCIDLIIIDVEIFDKKKEILRSSYKSLLKLLLAIVDSCIPFIFILLVCFYWVVCAPLAAPAIFTTLFLVILYFKKTVKKSIDVNSLGEKNIEVESYLMTEEYERLRRVLLFPMYVTFVTYLVMGVLICFLAIFVKNYTGDTANLRILLILTALAILRLRSFVGIVAKIGSYYRPVAPILKLLRSHVVDNGDLCCSPGK